jgi:hypothetical protein
MISVAQSRYARGRELTARERRLRHYELERNVARMRARADEPGAFFEAAAFVFYLAHRAWYEVLCDRWSQSVHRALPEILARDPQFHRRLEALWSAPDPEARIAAAEAILAHLFGDAPPEME